MNEQGGAYAMEMKPFPVVRVHRAMRGQELIFHCAMIECETAEEAVAGSLWLVAGTVVCEVRKAGRGIGDRCGVDA